jgi:SAM-dependent methyltransferase
VSGAVGAQAVPSVSSTACRLCGGGRLFHYLSLGAMPLANAFLRREDLGAPEPRIPLDVLLCEDCGLSQLREVVRPDVLFKQYLYVSSTSDLVVRHARWLARTLVDRHGLGPEDLVVEVASNDGCVLQAFRALGLRALGVEPAANIAALARAAGIETRNEFFDAKLGRTLRAEAGPARVIVARHVLAHVDAILDFVEGLRDLLAADGVIVVEVPYLVDLLENVEYDTIYDEHLSYFSLGVLRRLFARVDLEVFDVHRLAIHGGSVLVQVQHRAAGRPVAPIVGELLAREHALRLDARAPYLAFAERVAHAGRRLRRVLAELEATGARIAGYGAAAKGNVLLNYCGIGPRTLDYIVDKSPLKHHLYTPGTHIPVFPVARLAEQPPDYLLILAWNFAEEIMGQQAAFARAGGRFIVPVPDVRIVDPGRR